MEKRLETLQTILLLACVLLAVVTSFLGGMLLMQKQKNKVIAVNVQEIDQYSQTLGEYTETITFLQDQVVTMEETLAFYDTQTQDYSEEKQELLIQINKLKNKITNLNAEMEKLNSNNFPFQVPTTGTVATSNGFYGGVLYGMDHLGIDIWTTTANSGQLPNHKGNPVFAACNGVVVSFQEANGGMSIKCDLIDKTKGYDLPSYDVYTYYGHMGNGVTKQLYFQVAVGERVKAGQLLGYQGDLSSFFPNMRNVHLHFSVFTGLGETDPNGGAIDPCLYIGGDCQLVGYQFKI